MAEKNLLRRHTVKNVKNIPSPINVRHYTKIVILTKSSKKLLNFANGLNSSCGKL